MQSSVLNNDRILHWFASAILGWSMSFVLFGLPIFHLWLAVPVAKILAFSVCAICVHMAFVPALFSARATPDNPMGRPASRRLIVSAWMPLTFLLFTFFVLQGSIQGFGVRMVIFGSLFVIGVAALIGLLLSRRDDRAQQ